MLLDIVRVFTGKIAPEDIQQHLRDQLRVKWCAVRLPHPVHVAVGGEFDEHEVTPADARLRIAGDEGLNVGESHGQMLITQ